MTGFPLTAQESATAAALVSFDFDLCRCEADLRASAQDNAAALARLAEADKRRLRDAYRAKRDELKGART